MWTTARPLHQRHLLARLDAHKYISKIFLAIRSHRAQPQDHIALPVVQGFRSPEEELECSYGNKDRRPPPKLRCLSETTVPVLRSALVFAEFECDNGTEKTRAIEPLDRRCLS